MVSSDRVVEKLDILTQVLRHDEFTLAGRRLKASEIVSLLKPHLTAERINRIEQVISGRTFHVATVVEHLYDIGNISAVMRSAESFGYLPFHIIEKPGARYKKSDRVSKGSEKWLDLHKWSKTGDCLARLKDQGYRIYVTTLDEAVPLEDQTFDGPTAIVFGNEKEGVSPQALEWADQRVAIPMKGFTQSFNISVAAALSFYQIYQKRVAGGGKSGDLSDLEQEQVRASYYLRTLDSAEEIIKSKL